MSNKQKNSALAVALLLVLFLCYKLAIGKTIVLKKELNALRKETVLSKNIPNQLAILAKKNNTTIPYLKVLISMILHYKITC